MKIFKIVWRTNYGETVALVEAQNKEAAISLLKQRDGLLWNGYDIEEMCITGEERIISIEGGG